MDNDIKKLFQEAARARMSPAEREAVRQALMAFIAEHPVRPAGFFRRGRERSRFGFIPQSFMRPMPIALLVLVLVGAGGGVSLAAEGSLPGDVLYPVKVSVNEEVRSALTFSLESKTAWEAKRVERRLEEAEALATQDSLAADTRAVVEERFSAQAARVRDRIDALEARGDIQAAAELSSNFEASLSAHARILGNLLATTSTAGADGKREIEKLRVVIGRQEEHTTAGRVELEVRFSQTASTTQRTAAEGRLRAAEAKIREVQFFIDRERVRLGPDATARAEARLLVASSTLAEGKAKLDAGAYGEAFVTFQRAHRIAEEAKLFVNARRKLDIDIDIDIDLGVASGTEREDRDDHGRDGDDRGDADGERSQENEKEQKQSEERGRPADDASHREEKRSEDGRGAIQGSAGVDVGVRNGSTTGSVELRINTDL